MARSASSGACGWVSVITTVCASVAGIFFTAVSRKPHPPLVFFDRFSE